MMNIIPKPYRLIIFNIWITVIIAQWLVVTPAAVYHQVFFQLPGEYPDLTRIVPFGKDVFFWVWNILPLALASSTYLIAIRLSRVISATADEKKQDANDIIARTMDSLQKPVLMLIVIVSALIAAGIGSTQQFVKIHKWYETLETVYWWDLKFSNLIFYVRLAALAVNLFCMVFWFAILLALIIAFTKLTHAKLWSISLLHFDGCGGMKEYGRATLAFTIVPFIIGVCGLIGYYDHRGIGLIHTASDLLLIIMAAVIGIILVFIALKPIHREMRNQKKRACRKLISQIQKIDSQLPAFIEADRSAETMEHLKALKSDHDALDFLYKSYKEAPTWPVNIRTWFKMVGTVLGPILVIAVKLISAVLLRR